MHQGVNNLMRYLRLSRMQNELPSRRGLWCNGCRLRWFPNLRTNAVVVPLRGIDLYQPRKLWRLRSTTAWKLRSRPGLVKNLNHALPIFNYITALFFAANYSAVAAELLTDPKLMEPLTDTSTKVHFFCLIVYLISFNRSLPLLSSMLQRRSVISSTKTGKHVDHFHGQ